MRRSVALLALVGLAACQDYQFTPVGRCLLQPGYASVSTASAVDVLFVVDDSFSMDPIQASLASNLQTFINRLAQKQQQRVAAKKEPYDFHIAVTSSSVRVNRYLSANGECGRVTPGLCSIDTVTTPPARSAYTYACTTGQCGDIVTNYYNYIVNNNVTVSGCLPGVLRKNGDPFPAGTFVAAGTNPKVLSFTRSLNWANATGDATIKGLIDEFKQNVVVGSCGANQEMPLEAARLAIQKGLAGQQGLAWPHPNSKIAVIVITDEDDCSTKRADQGGLVWDNSAVGQDACYVDAQRTTPVGLYPVSDYRAFFTGLGRPVAAAFVRPGFTDCNNKGGPGTRLHALATALTGDGVPVVESSVCGDFAGALEAIADELPPADRLELPSAPAAGVVTQLRVQATDGTTLHVCTGPGSSDEWWFVDCSTSAVLPTGQTSACVAVKPGGACEARAGQTLQAEYLGRIPASGCATADDCAVALGGGLTDWACEGATAGAKGTCVCSSR